MTDRYAAVEYLNLKFYLRQLTKQLAVFPAFDQQGTLAGKLGAITQLTTIANQHKQAVRISKVRHFLSRVKRFAMRKLNRR